MTDDRVDRFLTREPLLPADPQLTAKLRARIAAEARAPAAPWWRAFAPLAAAAAVVALLVALREEPAPVKPAPAPVRVAVATPAPSPRASRPPVEPARVAAALHAELARLDQEIGALGNDLAAYRKASAANAKTQHERMMARSFESWK